MITFPNRRLVACGVDIGTTNAKVVAIDQDGRVRARASRPTPRDAHDLSIDAESLLDTIEEMIIEVCGDSFAAMAVATAGIGEDGVLTDADIRPLNRALAWFDPRRVRVFREISPQLEAVEDLPVDTDSSRTIVGWRWAARQVRSSSNPPVWLALTDFASARWSGRTFMSDTLAARTAAWSLAHRTWIGSRVDVTLGDRHMVPQVLHAGEPVGAWRSERLTRAGVLMPEALVVAGGHDHPIGGWGVDRAHPGAVIDSMGTAEVVVAQTRTRLLSRTAGVDLAPGIRQSGTTLLCVQELARNVDWAAQDPEVGRMLKAIVAGHVEPDGALLSAAFIPGAAGGARPRYAAGAPSTSLSRASAVLGALASLGEDAISRVSSRVGPDARVFASGGWSRSPGWIRLKESLTGRSFGLIREPEIAAVGAALLAAEAVGWTPSSELVLGSTTQPTA